MKIGERIKIARENSGLTQSELGDLVGKKKQSILRYEKNENEITLGVANDIAHATGTSVEYLANGTMKEFTNNSRLAQLFKELDREDENTKKLATEMIEAILLRKQAMRLSDQTQEMSKK